MIKLITKILQVRVYKWLIIHNQELADSWTRACTSKKNTVRSQKEIEIDNAIWLEKWNKYNSAIDRLTDKLENI